MKKIQVYVKPEGLDSLIDALRCEGVVGLSVAEVKGFGLEDMMGSAGPEWCKVGLTPGFKVELVVQRKHVDDLLDLVSETLKDAGMLGGRVFVTPVDDAVHTRTGRRGVDAIAIQWRR
jgi:nitrogen regulatory protein P-II 1